MTYEELKAENGHLNTQELDLSDISGLKGFYIDRNIAIHRGIPTQKEKSCILAEGLGHYYTTYGNILDQSKSEYRKQERRARLWGYNKLIGLQ